MAPDDARPYTLLGHSEAAGLIGTTLVRLATCPSALLQVQQRLLACSLGVGAPRHVHERAHTLTCFVFVFLARRCTPRHLTRSLTTSTSSNGSTSTFEHGNSNSAELEMNRKIDCTAALSVAALLRNK